MNRKQHSGSAGFASPCATIFVAKQIIRYLIVRGQYSPFVLAQSSTISLNPHLLLPVPNSLLPIHYSLLPSPYSLFPIPCILFSVL